MIVEKIKGGIEVIRIQERRHQQLLMILRKQESTGNWKRNHWTALCGELTFEKAKDLS
jgi:hypothetical protein